MKLYCGIDPGWSGGIAFIDENSNYVASYLCPATPQEMANCLSYYALPDFVGIEAVHSFPKQGVSSTWKFASNFGMWFGILATLKISYELISPAKWIRFIGGAKKGESKEQAWLYSSRRWPDAPLKLKRHSAIAEALVLAEMARMLKKGK